MKTELKAPVGIAIAVVALGLVVWFGAKSMSSVGSLDHGQIQYTPGKPPWMEKDPKKGLSGGANQAASGAPGGAPIINNGKS